MRKMSATTLRVWRSATHPNFRQGSMARAKARPLVRAIVLAGIVMPAVVLSIAMWSEHASAATTYCGRHQQTGTQGGVTWGVIIDVYGDPACSGTRARAYDHYATTTATLDVLFLYYLRTWYCGLPVVDLQNLAYVPSNGHNWWVTWDGSANCGFQSDQYTNFYKAGVINANGYTNW